MLGKLQKLLSTPPAQLGRAHQFLRFQLKMWWYCASLLRKNRAGQQAAALAYHSIFGLVPLVLVMVLVFQSFPGFRVISTKVRTMAYEQLSLTEIKIPLGSDSESPAVEVNEPMADGDSSNPAEAAEDATHMVLLTDYLESMIQRFFVNLDQGSITVIGAAFVVWAAIGLLTTTERAFNNIWHVSRGRSWVSRILNYWGLLTLGPLLIGLGFYSASTYAAASHLQETVSSHVGPLLMSYLVTWVAFFLLYFILPNAHVDPRAALWGAAVGALVWTAAKGGFNQYVTNFIPYSKVYGVVGLIPLTLFWIYVTWLIVLFGLQLTFTTQYLRTLDEIQTQPATADDVHFLANDVTVINLLREVAWSFENQQAPVPEENICSRMDLPPALGQRLLAHLVESGLLLKTSEPAEGYSPACAPEKVTLDAVRAVVARAAFSQTIPHGPPLDSALAPHRQKLTEINLRQLLDRPVDEHADPA